MKLWVRSQDREKFMKADYFYLEQNSIIGYSQSTFTSPVLGKYKRKERALEVLDEIQDRLLKSKYDKAREDYGKHSDCKDTLIEISSSNYVYEMPKE